MKSKYRRNKEARNKRSYVNSKCLKLPDKYRPGYLQAMDKRSIIYMSLKNTFDEVVIDLGGVEGLSHTKLSLIERYSFMEHVLRHLEQQYVGDPDNSIEIFSRWVQSLNAFLGLSKSLGLERRARKVESLEALVEKKNRRKTG